MINNKTEIRIYQLFKISFILVLLIFILSMTITKTIGNQYIIISKDLFYSLFALNFIMSILMLIIEKLQPTYIEFHSQNNEIIIKTYEPNPRSLKSFLNFLGYRKNMKEYRVNRDEFTNYKLTVGRFGFRKELKLQRTNNNKVYESASINLSFIGQKNYTNLVLAIDRLCKKICLN